MKIDRIARCVTCNHLDFVNKDALCEFCVSTAEWLPSSGFVAASETPVEDIEAAS